MHEHGDGPDNSTLGTIDHLQADHGLNDQTIVFCIRRAKGEETVADVVTGLHNWEHELATDMVEGGNE